MFSYTRNFASTDKKGRVIGATVKFLDHDDQGYGMVVHATRNGVPYGASQPRQYFTNMNLRFAACNKYLASAAKRALKVAA